MKNITAIIRNKILDKLVEELDGNLPYMTAKEKEKYNNYIEEINQDYDNFIYSNKKLVPEENQEQMKIVVEKYTETCTCRNALLNDLYYKDGVRDGICLFLECLRSD